MPINMTDNYKNISILLNRAIKIIEKLSFPTTFAIILVFAFIRLSLVKYIELNWDFPLLVNGIWRLMNGQIAMHDYHSPIGQIAFIPGSIGALLLGNSSLFAINFGICVFGILVSVAILYILNALTTKITASATAITAAFILITPRTMNYETNYLSYTGWYNAIGIALLSFAFVALFGNSKLQNLKKLRLRGVALGLVVAALLLLKWTFALAALLAITIYVIRFLNTCQEKIRFSKSFAVTLLSTFLTYMAVVSFDIFGLISNIIQPISANSRSSGEYFETITLLFSNNVVLWLAIFSSSILSIYLFSKYRINWSIVVFLIFGTQLFCTSTITQPPEIVVAPVLGILLLNQLETQHVLIGPRSKFRYFSKRISKILIVGIALFLILSQWILNTAGPTQRFIAQNKDNISAIFEVAFGSQEIEDTPESKAYSQDLKKYTLKYGQFITVGINDYFTWNWGIAPAKGDLLYWHTGMTFSNKNIFSDTTEESLLENINVIALAKFGIGSFISEDFENLYKDYLSQNFTRVVNKTEYEIFVRNSKK